MTKRTENISAREEKLAIPCMQCKDMIHPSRTCLVIIGGINADKSQKFFVTDLCLSFSYWGRFIASSLGRMWMNTLQIMEVSKYKYKYKYRLDLTKKHLRTHGAIVCVCGVRK